MAGGREAVEPLADLFALLLGLTVMAIPQGAVRAFYGPDPLKFVLGGRKDPVDPLPLRDGRFLRMTVSLYVDVEDRNYLKVEQASYQYQDGREWVFRYEYLRNPPHHYPASHLQVNADLRVPGVLPVGLGFERIHLPVGRFPIEWIVRLLAEQFGITTNEPPEIWRPVLAQSERIFVGIAHRPPSGPAA